MLIAVVMPFGSKAAESVAPDLGSMTTIEQAAIACHDLADYKKLDSLADDEEAWGKYLRIKYPACTIIEPGKQVKVEQLSYETRSFCGRRKGELYCFWMPWRTLRKTDD